MGKIAFKSFQFYWTTFSLKRCSMRIQWMNEKWNFIGLGWSETFLENPILDQNGSQLLKTHFFDVALLWSARVLCNPLSFLSLLHSHPYIHTYANSLTLSLSLSVSLASAHTFGHTLEHIHELVNKCANPHSHMHKCLNIHPHTHTRIQTEAVILKFLLFFSFSLSPTYSVFFSLKMWP